MRHVVAWIPGLVMLGLALSLGSPAGSLDDVFVVLADARAWFVGDGWVAANAGVQGDLGTLPVEGSTSLLDWALKGMGLRLFPGADPLRMAGWMGLVWLIAAVVVSVGAAARWTGSLLVASAVGCLIALSPGLAESAGYLLEGPLFGLLWILALVAAVEGRPVACLIWSVLLAAARPEGLALAPVLVGWAGRSGIGGWWRWGAAGALASGAVTALRFGLYGAWLPNTFAAKSSDSRWREIQDGAAYIVDVLHGSWSSSMVAVAFASAVIASIWLSRRPCGDPCEPATLHPARGLLVMAALYACGVVFSGGDSYTGARLFMPIALPIWLALGASLSGHSISRGVVPLTLSSAALLVAILGPDGTHGTPAPWRRLPTVVRSLTAGPVGLEAFAGDEKVFSGIAAALSPDGVFAHLHTQRYRWFEPGTPVLDLTGLTDREVARQPHDGRVRFGRAAVALAIERRVGAIHLDPLRGRVTALVNAPDLVQALSDPRLARRYLGEPFLRPELAVDLARDYVAASRRLPNGAGYFNLLVRKDLAEAFQRQGFRVGKG